MRLEAPLQSWGTSSRFSFRDTGREPSKSGVIGLLCAALGRPRTMTVDDLASMPMGVRIDRQGVVAEDFHTVGGGARGVAKASGAKPQPSVSRRAYLQDASFTVGLSCSRDLARGFAQALQAPTWPLSLGRRSCIPSRPLTDPDSVVDLPLLDALRSATWIAPVRGDHPEELEVVLECALDDADELRSDHPVGAAFAARTFAPRGVRRLFIPVPGASLDALSE